MTTELFTPHPLERDRIRPGDILYTWCSVSMDRERHLYQPGQTRPLVCLHCHPELDPERQDTDDQQS